MRYVCAPCANASTPRPETSAEHRAEWDSHVTNTAGGLHLTSLHCNALPRDVEEGQICGSQGINASIAHMTYHDTANRCPSWLCDLHQILTVKLAG